MVSLLSPGIPGSFSAELLLVCSSPACTDAIFICLSLFPSTVFVLHISSFYLSLQCSSTFKLRSQQPQIEVEVDEALSEGALEADSAHWLPAWPGLPLLHLVNEHCNA